MFSRKFCLNRISLDADENFTLQASFVVHLDILLRKIAQLIDFYIKIEPDISCRAASDIRIVFLLKNLASPIDQRPD